MEKLKVGMVGIGRATSYGSVFAHNEKTEVVALCDKHIFTNYEDFLNTDIDIVVLGTPIPSHADEVCKALALDKHVLCEVTAADTIQDCERIVEAVRKSKGKYMMAENCIYMDFCMEWKHHIDKGRIGTPFYAEADYVHEIRDRVANKWRANRAPIHYCSHSLGPILHWMDDYVVRATASGNRSTMIEPATIGNIDMQVALRRKKVQPLRFSAVRLLCGTQRFAPTESMAAKDLWSRAALDMTVPDIASLRELIRMAGEKS